METNNDESALQSRMTFSQKFTDRVAKDLTTYFGTVGFLLFMFAIIIIWVLVNVDFFPSIQPFDPFPFYILMVPFELFGVLLSVIVLINQNRESKIADVRQQIDLEINVRAENEITKILQMMDELHKRVGIEKPHDEELEEMKEKIDIEEIKEVVESEQEQKGIDEKV